MLGEELKKLLKKVSLAAVGLMTGVGLTLMLTQYPGVVELRMTTEEGYLKVDGSLACKSEPVIER